MRLPPLPTGITDWSKLPPTAEPGASGSATMRTRDFGGIKLRLIDYSAGYRAGDWCDKAHIVYVIEGSLVVTHRDGRRFELTPGLAYHVADGEDGHQVSCEHGARIFIVD
jgi:hypothetical protein